MLRYVTEFVVPPFGDRAVVLATARSRSTGRQTLDVGARCPGTVGISPASILTQTVVRYVTHIGATLSVRFFTQFA
jgi:hypothetical protein